MSNHSLMPVYTLAKSHLGCKIGRTFALYNASLPVSEPADNSPQSTGTYKDGENLSLQGGIVRIFSIPVLAFSSAIAWYVIPVYIIVLAPVAFYMIVTAFTLYCPIKAVWCNAKRFVINQLKINCPDIKVLNQDKDIRRYLISFLRRIKSVKS